MDLLGGSMHRMTRLGLAAGVAMLAATSMTVVGVEPSPASAVEPGGTVVSRAAPEELPEPAPDPDCAKANAESRWYGSLTIKSQTPTETGIVQQVSNPGTIAGECELKANASMHVTMEFDDVETYANGEICLDGSAAEVYMRRKGELDLSKTGSKAILIFDNDDVWTDDPLAMRLQTHNNFPGAWAGGLWQSWDRYCGRETYESGPYTEYQPFYGGEAWLETQDLDGMGDNPEWKCPNMRLASVDATHSSGVCTWEGDDGYSMTYTWDFTKQPISAVAPGAPGIGVAASGKAGSPINATAKWGPPASNGGSPITAYKVQAQKLNASGAVVQRINASAAAQARRLTMVLPKARYKFRVAAVNAKGQSAWSRNANIVNAR